MSYSPRLRTPEECIQRWEREWRRWQFIRPKAKTEEGEATTVALGREAEALLVGWLRSRGYEVETTSNNEHHDLVVNGRLRIEVKLSTWNEHRDRSRRQRRFRYQWNIRAKQKPHLVICLARNGEDWPFVIPGQVLADQQSVTIRTFDPAAYTGKWAPYRNAWELIEEALDNLQGEVTGEK